MNSRKIFFQVIFVFSFIGICFSQTDSNLILYRTEKNDSIKLKHLINHVKFLLRAGELDSALTFCDLGISIAKKSGLKDGLCTALSNKGILLKKKGDYTKALTCYLEALSIAESIGNKNLCGSLYGNIANIKRRQNLSAEAVLYGRKALFIRQQINDSAGMASSYSDLGNVFSDNTLDYDSALFYQLKALSIREKINDNDRLLLSYQNVGVAYGNKKDYKNAAVYFEKALKLAEEMNDIESMTGILSGLGLLYLDIKEFKKSEEYLTRAFAMAEKTGVKGDIEQICLELSGLYSETGEFQKAFNFYKRYSETKDSLLNQENSKVLTEMEKKYSAEKKEKENKLLQSENELSNQTINQQKQFSYFIITALGLAMILIFFVFRGYRQKKKDNLVITQQKEEVHLAMEIVEEKQKEITDSINYAKRIQRGILPSDEELSSFLGDHFVLFKPKDIVSGDFYWATSTTTSTTKIRLSVIAAVDCTGHGVPGAFMSMLGKSLMHQTIKDPNINSPADVLDYMNRELPKNLRSHEQNVSLRDGMDLGLCAIDHTNNILYFSGANNPCWVIRNKECTELKPDKQAISAAVDVVKKPFTNQKMELQTGDCIYLFTDGYPDQFGGPKGKKFKYKQLETILTRNSGLEMQAQKKILEHIFEEWRGDLEQIDDVLIIGIKI